MAPTRWKWTRSLASNSRWRPLVIPPPPEENVAPTEEKTASQNPQPASPPVRAPASGGTRCRYIKWAELMRLTFGLTVDQ